MKTDNTTQPKPNTLKNTIKPLNDKKSIVNSQLQQAKDQSKKNLNMKSPVHTNSRNQNVRSPKNFQLHHSTQAINNDIIIQDVKREKGDVKKVLASQKSKKSLQIQKFQAIKKQNIPSLKSPGSSKPLLIQSQTNISSQKCKSNQQSDINDLSTSIIQTFIQLNSNILQQTQTKQINYTKQSTNLQQMKQLKRQNSQLKRKYQKLKTAHEQGRKKLRDRITNFNQEGEEIMNFKNQIYSLQNQNTILQQKLNQQAVIISNYQPTTNQSKSQQNKFQKDANCISKSIKIELNKIQQQLFSIQIQNYISQSEGASSSINGNSSSQAFDASISHEKQKSSQSDAQNILPALQIQLIKSSFQQKYSDKLSKIQQIYDQNLKDVESRYKLLYSQIKQITIQQENQISSLQKTIDKFYEQTQNCTCNKISHKLTIQTSEQQLEKRLNMNKTRYKINQKDEIIKKCRQQFRIKQLQCKRVLSQLDIERIKYNLKSQVLITHKQLQSTAEKQQNQLLKQQLKQQRQQKFKLLNQNHKKQQIIKKMSSQQNVKKIRK